MCPVTETIFFFFFNDTATTEIYTLSLHDALPICKPFTTEASMGKLFASEAACRAAAHGVQIHGDRKSTRLNSSHDQISYAVFCLKKKKTYKLGSLSNLEISTILLLEQLVLYRDTL